MVFGIVGAADPIQVSDYLAKYSAALRLHA